MNLKAETDSDGNGMGPRTDETPAWIGALMDEMGQGLPPPKSMGEVSPNFDQRIGVQRWGQKTVCRGTAMGVEWNMGRGSRGRRSGVHDFLQLRDGLALTSCLCFVLQLSDGLSCAHAISCVCH